MTDNKEFRDYKLYILDKFKYFEQEIRQLKCDIDKLQAEVHKQEVEYAKDVNTLKGRIMNLEEASKTFPTKESVDTRLKDLEQVNVGRLPGEVETLKQYQWTMQGKMIAYSSIAGAIAAVGTILAYAYL